MGSNPTLGAGQDSSDGRAIYIIEPYHSLPCFHTKVFQLVESMLWEHEVAGSPEASGLPFVHIGAVDEGYFDLILGRSRVRVPPLVLCQGSSDGQSSILLSHIARYIFDWL